MHKLNIKKNRYATRTSPLVVAILSIFVVGLSTSAYAVNLTPRNLGDAMIFPYYTTRNGFATFFNITNTSNQTLLMKVRWNEGENGRQAQAFNVILSPNDVWTVATVGASDGGARAITNDNSCTTPLLPTLDTTTSSDSTTGINFSNTEFTGTNFDTGNTGLDRTREGYFTVFEMGRIDPTISGLNPEQTSLANRIIASAQHNNIGNNQAIPGEGDTELPDVPTDCGFINSLFENAANLAKISNVTSEPINALKGRAVLIELSTGVAFGYDPIVFENFYTPQGIDGKDKGNLLTLPADTSPNLNSANPAAISATLINKTVFTSDTFERPVDVISYLLSRTSIINDYNITSGSQTDWVISFPTKSFYVDRKVGSLKGDAFKLPASLSPGDNGDPLPPFIFAEAFADPDTDNDGQGDISDSNGESCLQVALKVWDREEFETRYPVRSGFTGAHLVSPPVELCKETNIFSFMDSNIFDSKLRYVLSENEFFSMPGSSGWMQMSPHFDRSTFPLAATGTISMIGLPMTGMRLEARRNSKFAGKNYGFASDHAYTRNIPF